MKIMFIVAAIWNLNAAVMFGAIAIFNKGLLSLWYNYIPENMLFFYLFFVAVALFGVGYYWVSQDIVRNRDIIKLGLIGKLAVFGFYLAYTISGDITMMGLSAAGGDLVFAVLFIDVLRRMPQLQLAES